MDNNLNFNGPALLTGKIVVKFFGKFSKFEHVAFYLVTKSGAYIIQLRGEEFLNAVNLRNLDNKIVLVKGIVKNYSVFASTIVEIGTVIW